MAADSCISSQLYIQWPHDGSLKSAIMGVVTPCKLANAIKSAIFLKSWFTTVHNRLRIFEFKFDSLKCRSLFSLH